VPTIQDTEKQQDITLPSSSSSLRLRGLAQAWGALAQASSLRLGESSTIWNSGYSH